MFARPIAVAAAVVAGVILTVGPPPAVDRVAGPSAGALRIAVFAPRELPRARAFPDAQPCLIDTVSCLELSPEPFAPCLLAVERCRGEWRLYPLVGRNAD
jgi:hypothetical protein